MKENNLQKIIYVCDDDSNISNLIKLYLENSKFLVKTFDTSKKLLDAIKKKKPNLITLDIMLPDKDGFSTLVKIKKECEIPVILVSAKDKEIDKVKGFNEGSDDYIVKPFMPLELVARVRNVLRREERNMNNINQVSFLKFSNVKIDINANLVYIDKNQVAFTNIEYKFLVYMFSKQNKIVSKNNLLFEVWGYDEEDNRVIDDLLKRLRKKLIKYKAKINIQTVFGIGYRLIDEKKNKSLKNKKNNS